MKPFDSSAASRAPAHAPMPQFPLRAQELAVGGRALSRLAAQVGQTPFYAYDRALLRERVASCAPRCRQPVKLHYAMKANPMPALVGFMAGLVDGIDVASAGELKVALDAGADPARDQLRRPGKRESELRQAVAAGVLVNVESMRELRLLAPISAGTGPAGARGGARQPRLRAQGLGHEDGRRAQAVRCRCGAGARAAGGDRAAGLRSRASTSLPARRTCAPSRSARRRTRATNWRCGWPRRHLRRCAFSTWAAASASRTFPGEQRLDLAPIGDNLAALAARAARRAARGRHRDRAGPLLGRRGGRVRHAHRRPQGLARPGLPGHRRRPEPPPVGLGQLRPGDPQELPGHHRQQGRVGEREVASVVGPLCTPLDLLADRMELPWPAWAIWWWSSSRVPMAPAPARRPFWGIRPCAEVLVFVPADAGVGDRHAGRSDTPGFRSCRPSCRWLSTITPMMRARRRPAARPHRPPTSICRRCCLAELACEQSTITCSPGRPCAAVHRRRRRAAS
jgi:diaminopimelate decarboxylase